MQLTDPVAVLPRVGKAKAHFLARLGIHTIKDLLWHVPARYTDYSAITPIAQLRPNQEATVMGTISTIASRRSFRRRLSVQTALLTDDSGSIEVIWFNQPFLSKNLSAGSVLQLSGKAVLKNLHLQLVSPVYEATTGLNLHTGRVVPFYPLTADITQKELRSWMHVALKECTELAEDLPKQVLKAEKLLTLSQALHAIHFPETEAQAQQGLTRLAFEELLVAQLFAAQQRALRATQKAPQLPIDELLLKNFVQHLPFRLTTDQRKAGWEIVQDLAKPTPMNRLLEGDVGSGKTVVAALASLSATRSGYQVALLAPTEILAWQHYQTLCNLLAPYQVRLALVTATKTLLLNTKSITRKQIDGRLARGTIDFVVGTHAVLQENTKFKQLGLVIIDEQHRFGVTQRHVLLRQSKKQTPHFLSMTATPIPRSLALTAYGDLDLSVIRTRPKNRKPIKTFVVPRTKRAKAYAFLNKEIEQGHQVFVVYPLIEESEKLQVKAASKEFARLSQEVFPHRRLALLHGKIKRDEKDRIMSDFQKKKIDILVATSVIEVGIDIPNATVMMIENAERFGLAQLHQLRGRVGRSDLQSYCFLFTDSASAETVTRLKALEESQDGIALAERDLAIRGSGQLWGTAQSGFYDFKVATTGDINLIARAQLWARKLVTQPHHKHPALWEQVKAFYSSVHPE